MYCGEVLKKNATNISIYELHFIYQDPEKYICEVVEPSLLYLMTYTVGNEIQKSVFRSGVNL